MSVQTSNPSFKFQLPSLSYIDAKWEEPSLRAPVQPVRQTGLSGWLARRVAAYRTWQSKQQAAAEMAMMSDHELKDIGITRSDLDRLFDPAFNQDLVQRGMRG